MFIIGTAMYNIAKVIFNILAAICFSESALLVKVSTILICSKAKENKESAIPIIASAMPNMASAMDNMASAMLVRVSAMDNMAEAMAV